MVVAIVLAAVPALAADPQLYFTTGGSETAERMNLDGTGHVQVVDLDTHAFGLAVDRNNSKVYVCEYYGTEINKMDLDGSNLESLVTGRDQMQGIAVDPLGGKIYWIEYTSTPSNGFDLKKANLDGSTVETAYFTASDWCNGLDLDLTNGKIYYTDGTAIRRVNLDGSVPEDVVTSGLSHAWDVKVDPAGGYIYVSDFNADKILRASLDGSGLTTLYDSIQLNGIALDVPNGEIYMVDRTKYIRKAPLDGSGPISLVHDVTEFNEILFCDIGTLYEPAVVIPEPAGLGLVGLALLAMRRRRS